MEEPTTTIRVYISDRDWLANKQRELAPVRGWLSYADMFRDIIDTLTGRNQ